MTVVFILGSVLIGAEDGQISSAKLRTRPSTRKRFLYKIFEPPRSMP